MSDDLKIEAIVMVNNDEALVLNRPLNLLYEEAEVEVWGRKRRGLLGKDGPFRAMYYHKQPRGRFKAFGGRKFEIPLRDGGFEQADGQWWHTDISGLNRIAYQTKAALQKCYVFSGGYGVDDEALQEMLLEYDGPTYAYWDYEKVIKYDDMRMGFYHRERKLERDKKHLIANVKAAHQLLREVATP